MLSASLCMGMSPQGAAVLIAWGVTAVLLALLLIAAIGGPVADGNGNDTRRGSRRSAPRPSFSGRPVGVADGRPGLADLTRARIERERYLRSSLAANREPRTRAKRPASRHRGGRIDLVG